MSLFFCPHHQPNLWISLIMLIVYQTIFQELLLLNENKYEKSFKYLKKLNGLEKSHINYSIKYLYSLVNSGNFKEAFNYSKKLEKQNLDNFESHLISRNILS